MGLTEAGQQQTEQAASMGVTEFHPGPVLLLGAPGVGKGTQAQRLMRSFGVPQISTGDLLREHVREGSGLGAAAKSLMERGLLVPDELVNDMVADRLERPDAEEGYVLDGFPRTEAQAAWLDGELARRGGRPLIALEIVVPREELVERITGRRTCSLCRHIYNIYSNPPVRPGVCDDDGSPLVHRSDDTIEAFERRMVEHAEKTAAVITHYRAMGRFREIEGTGSLDAVEARIVVALDALRHAVAAPVEGAPAEGA